MSKAYRAGQVYGYIICLVAVVTFLVSIPTLIGAFFSLGDPLHASCGLFGCGFGQADLSSFEAYKMDVLNPSLKSSEGEKLQYVPDEETLKKMYESAKEFRIRSVRLEAQRSITVRGILIVVAILLFVTHWLWTRRLARIEA